MSLNTLEKLIKEELSNMVLEYQNEFDNNVAKYKYIITSLKDRFTKMESQLLKTRRVDNNLLK